MTPLPRLSATIGNTPLVPLQRIPGAVGAPRGNVILAKLEGQNPGGSVKDRPVRAMFEGAMARGELRAGDHLIEATSGNTGIAMAMLAAVYGIRLTLIMPDDLSAERALSMRAFGAEIFRTPAAAGGMEHARDVAWGMATRGEGRVLDQFGNPDNPRAHYETTGPEIWRDTGGRITHFVSAMGTTGTIMGVGRYLREQDPRVVIVGAQPAEGSRIPGIRRWNPGYEPKIFDPAGVDRVERVSQAEAEAMARRLAVEEGILTGPSAAGALAIALRVAAEVRDATLVFIMCDRGDRYLSTGLFG
jgi:S-sulfo-L-cysteine synthase (O-acetyl-L-serine-dependent)